MCELFGMSSAIPATINYSLKEFAKRGGLTHLNRAGWGIGYLEDRDVRLIKEAEEMDRSPWVDFIARRHITSYTVIAHVRYASVGSRTLENCHPFRQELGGRKHLFAHNGTVRDVFTRLPFEGERYRPRGGYLRELEEVGATVKRYQPGMLHAKAGIVDDIAWTGSANFDVRSLLLNFELALFAYDPGTVSALERWFNDLAAPSETGVGHARLPRRVVEGVFRLGAPVL